MLILKKEPKEDKYKKLIEYACEKYDTMMFVIRYDFFYAYYKEF